MEILAGESELGVAQNVEKMQSVSSAKHLIHTVVCPAAQLRPWPGKVLACDVLGLWVQPIRLLRPWDFPGQSTGVGHHHLLRQNSY